MKRKDQSLEDVKAWRELARHHMPDWRPTLQRLQQLDEGPYELGVALRTIARGWDKQDARWDVLVAVLEYSKRGHAHELAEQIRAADLEWGRVPDMDARDAADLIDPKAQRASTEGDTP